MSELYDTTAPSEEELNTPVEGYTFAEFKALSDDAVQEINQARITQTEIDTEHQMAELAQLIAGGDQEAIQAHNDAIGQKFIENFTTFSMLRQFNLWRKYGVPDRNVSREDVITYVSSLVRSRVAANPGYGAAPVKHYTTLTPRQQRVTSCVMSYTSEMRSATEPPVIDEYSLHHTMQLKSKDVKKLVQNGILEPTDPDESTGSYLLAGQYYDNWLINQIRDEEKEITPPKTEEETMIITVGGISVAGVTPEQADTLKLREAFVNYYFEEKGWSVDDPTIEQILEVRAQPGWQNPNI